MAKGKKTGGRGPGTPNKRTAEAAAAIEDAFAHLQNAPNTKARRDFRSWAEDNASDFYKLIFPKLLPVQLQMGSGAPGSGKLVIEWQTDSSGS